jgi:hypothetical protein
MRRSRGIRAVLAVALLTALALAPTAGSAAGDAGGPRLVSLPVALKIDVIEHPNGACNAGAYWEYSEVNGATSYTIQFLDSGREVTYTQPPFDAGLDATAPRGTHRAGLTGYSSSGGGCGDPEAGWRARFVLVRATALVELRDGAIVGRVTKDGKPMKGIAVTAFGPNPRGPGSGRGPYPRQAIFHSVTRANGSYRITVPKNKHYGCCTVYPDLSQTGSWVPSREVRSLSGGTVTADFAALRLPPTVEGAVATLVEIKTVKDGQTANAQLSRDGRWVPLDELLTTVRPGDRIRTDRQTVVAFELDLGGRIAIRPGSEIEIVDDRHVRDANKRWRLTKGGVWSKCGQMTESLEIQTTGGVMGIKG